MKFTALKNTNLARVLAVGTAAVGLAISVCNVPSFAKGAPPARQFRAQVSRQAQPATQRNNVGPGQALRRDANINQTINNNYGHLGGHYGQLEGQNQSIQRQTMNDANRNGGYLTGGQNQQINREETDLSRETSFDNQSNSFVQNHPRRAQVLGRDASLGYSINRNEGHLSGQYGNLSREDNSIARQEQNDARANGGYITKGQQGQLNREETALGNQMKYDNTNNPFVQNHPRRAEVLGRDANLSYSINKDEGHLGGNYGALSQDDKSIQRQEQMDARANGGYITTQQQQQLNQEENQLRSQIQQDYSK